MRPGRFIAGLLALLLICGSVSVQADPVDDLLSGKPVDVHANDLLAEMAGVQSGAKTAEVKAAESKAAVSKAAAQARLQQTLSDAGIDLSVDEAGEYAARRLGSVSVEGDAPARAVAEAAPTAINLVPEPSAIALATSALVYFLIFFRRRYAF